MSKNKGVRVSEKMAHAIWAKTNGHCAYCGCELDARLWTVDHATPVCKGGDRSLSNLFPCCKKCNSMKHARTVEEWRAYPREAILRRLDAVLTEIDRWHGRCPDYELLDLRRRVILERDTLGHFRQVFRMDHDGGF